MLHKRRYTNGQKALEKMLHLKPLKSMKLNINQKGFTNVSARLHLKLSNLFLLFCKTLLLPSKPFVSGAWYHPKDRMREAGSMHTISVKIKHPPAPSFRGRGLTVFEGLGLF